MGFAFNSLYTISIVVSTTQITISNPTYLKAGLIVFIYSSTGETRGTTTISSVSYRTIVLSSAISGMVVGDRVLIYDIQFSDNFEPAYDTDSLALPFTEDGTAIASKYCGYKTTANVARTGIYANAPKRVTGFLYNSTDLSEYLAPKGFVFKGGKDSASSPLPYCMTSTPDVTFTGGTTTFTPTKNYFAVLMIGGGANGLSNTVVYTSTLYPYCGGNGLAGGGRGGVKFQMIAIAPGSSVTVTIGGISQDTVFTYTPYGTTTPTTIRAAGSTGNSVGGGLGAQVPGAAGNSYSVEPTLYPALSGETGGMFTTSGYLNGTPSLPGYLRNLMVTGQIISLCTTAPGGSPGNYTDRDSTSAYQWIAPGGGGGGGAIGLYNNGAITQTGGTGATFGGNPVPGGNGGNASEPGGGGGGGGGGHSMYAYNYPSFSTSAPTSAGAGGLGGGGRAFIYY